MTLPTVQVFARAEELPGDVRALFDAVERRNLECGLDWYRTLAEEVFAGQGLARFLVLRDAGRCVAALPVQTGPEAGALSNYYSAYFEPPIAPDLSADRLVPLIDYLRRDSAHAGSFRFAPMDPDSAAFVRLEAACKASGLMPFRYLRFGNWHLPCEGLAWADYLASRPGMLRSTIKRMGRRFETARGRLEIIVDGAQVARGLDAFERVYASSWKKAEPYPGFVRALVQMAASKGWLRLGVAWLDGQAIAAQIWIVAHGRAEIFKLAYDEAHKSDSAGTLLTAHLMQHVLDVDQVSEVDYLIGDDPYKPTWMSARRERWGLVAYDPKTLQGIWGLLRETFGRLFKPAGPP